MKVQPILTQNIKTQFCPNKKHSINTKSSDISFEQFLGLDNGEKSVKDFLSFFTKLSNRYMVKTGENLEYATLTKDGKCNVVVDIPETKVAIFEEIAKELEKE